MWYIKLISITISFLGDLKQSRSCTTNYFGVMNSMNFWIDHDAIRRWFCFRSRLNKLSEKVRLFKNKNFTGGSLSRSNNNMTERHQLPSPYPRSILCPTPVHRAITSCNKFCCLLTLWFVGDVSIWNLKHIYLYFINLTKYIKWIKIWEFFNSFHS